MIQVNNLTKKAETVGDNLEELGVDVIDVEPFIQEQVVRVIAETDSDGARDEMVRQITSAYQYAVHSFDDETIGQIDIEIRQANSSGVVQFSVKREWLPADRSDTGGWDEMIDRVNATHTVIYDE